MLKPGLYFFCRYLTYLPYSILVLLMKNRKLCKWRNILPKGHLFSEKCCATLLVVTARRAFPVNWKSSHSVSRQSSLDYHGSCKASGAMCWNLFTTKQKSNPNVHLESYWDSVISSLKQNTFLYGIAAINSYSFQTHNYLTLARTTNQLIFCITKYIGRKFYSGRFLSTLSPCSLCPLLKGSRIGKS